MAGRLHRILYGLPFIAKEGMAINIRLICRLMLRYISLPTMLPPILPVKNKCLAYQEHKRLLNPVQQPTTVHHPAPRNPDIPV